MGATGVPCLPSCLETICPKGDTDLKKNREKLDYFLIGLKLSKAVREPHTNAQCARTDLNKRFLPKPITTTG